ncbi:hypothetical protein CA850_23695 [Micromonospora echinospora]|uniref:Uncharacterized protein n=1 Tax=Micromonospora echinospora TaxID=1877 RepID=A0A1C4X3Y6_MICEC|nr:hypothetical protein [Micromonospora echinospora]OZV77229.1 hypothetical protein CA850_23695 [Micromonospora echinospora]SCF03134.1 hypothetical protein GA0070618_2730 [Micromonospora echinospora]
MSTDSSWGDYLSTDTSVADTGIDAFAATVEPIMPVVEPVLPEPVLDVVDSEIAGAAADQDWSDWHAASGDQWAESAQDWVDYANENLAAGNLEAAESGMAYAADHAHIADSNYDVSLDYSTQAVTHLDTAVAEVAPYDTYDAGTSFDIAE